MNWSKALCRQHFPQGFVSYTGPKKVKVASRSLALTQEGKDAIESGKKGDIQAESF